MNLTFHSINNRVLLFFIALLCTSCGERFFPNKEYYYLTRESKSWLVDTVKYERFALVDSLSFRESFKLEYNWSAFNSSRRSSGVLGLRDREFCEYEMREQDFVSQMNKRLSIKIEAMEPPDMAILDVVIHDQTFRYSIGLGKLLMVSSKRESRPDSEYVNNSIIKLPLLSKVIRHDTIEINQHKYYDILEFVLKDFEDQWNDTTIISLMLAKEIGLIQYKQNGGHTFNRIIE